MPSPDFSQLIHTLRGPFAFLRPHAEEIRQLFPNGERSLPVPQRIYFTSESATPLIGFPVLLSPAQQQLSSALGDYLKLEEVAHLCRYANREPPARDLQVSWDRYCSLLARATENVMTSSYGTHFAGTFWLFHSLEVARILKETPRRVLRQDLRVGKEHGASIKYEVLHRYLDRVVTLTYDLASRLAIDTEEVEQELFPDLLSRMRDNVLIFTEDYIGPDLAELAHYFQGYLRLDGRDLRFRLGRLHDWHGRQLQQDQRLRAALRHLLQEDDDAEPRSLLKRPGYLRYLSSLDGYDEDELPTTRQIAVLESLLLKLKEFEVLHGLRRLIVPLTEEGGELSFRDRSLNRTWVGPSLVKVSSTTRPLDFLAPWVVDPQVDRYGLIYDITDFSQIISTLRRSGSEAQDRSFGMMFRLQRRVNRLATSHRLKMEKYLGDGAFYSARGARTLLLMAIQVQRYYRQALEEGFPFDHGLRIALNHGHYRLLPIDSGPGERERYEFFGHGVVELSRLTTGRATREIDEIKNFLLNQGYAEPVVQRFFAPLSHTNVDLIDRQEEKRRFHAYINDSGALVNEGIVATGQFVSKLGSEGYPTYYRARLGLHHYIVLPIDHQDSRILVGIRRMGQAHLKGLDPLPVYEVVDGDGWGSAQLAETSVPDLLEALEREFTLGIARQGASP